MILQPFLNYQYWDHDRHQNTWTFHLLRLWVLHKIEWNSEVLFHHQKNTIPAAVVGDLFTIQSHHRFTMLNLFDLWLIKLAVTLRQKSGCSNIAQLPLSRFIQCTGTYPLFIWLCISCWINDIWPMNILILLKCCMVIKE